ncbi:alpha/beta hydrolase family protein [Chitinophaga tropicalis]|uniref:Prolyl oligopeptidase family serine peptidase n=1 Tax=Chitinophaga tropicalis TaxID=2683588 RepID=A0A7K1UBV3_9BACT|nr:prolyl oligopeptidase family serine peptidase [Chitinophaga tropicalis]MVT11871.1 prolyl oligopeptidase family serine peptidase [Chitinophaga tropicalis]
MKKNSVFFLFVLACQFLATYTSQAQMKSIKPRTIEMWPDLLIPQISPDGKYCLYITTNFPNGFNTLTIKSTKGGEEHSFTSARNFENVSLDNNKATFRKGLDTVMIYYFSGKLDYYLGYNQVQSHPNDRNTIILRKKDSVTVLKSGKMISLPRVMRVEFINGGTGVFVHTFDTIQNVRSESILKITLHDMKPYILATTKEFKSLCFNADFNKMAAILIDSSEKQTKTAIVIDLTTNKVRIIKNSLDISELVAFTKTNNLILQLKYDTYSQKGNQTSDLRIWRYTDSRIPIAENRSTQIMKGCIPLNSDQLILLDIKGEKTDWNRGVYSNEWGNTWLISQTDGDCDEREVNWNPACKKRWFIISFSDGKRHALKLPDDPRIQYFLTPDEKYVVYYDREKDDYCSYRIADSSVVNLTNHTKLSYLPEIKVDTGGYIPFNQRGLAGWSKDGKSVFIYDDYDIWMFDLDGKSVPINITNGLGKDNKIVFSFINSLTKNIIDTRKEVIVTSLNTLNKFNGFYRCLPKQKSINPELLYQGPFIFYIPFYAIFNFQGRVPLKAASAATYIVRRESATEFPNYYSTSDFRSFTKLSDLSPENEYKWITTELHSWTLPDGLKIQGVLYKPSDFDSTKKYPLIFSLYEKQSNALNGYIFPDPVLNGCQINPLILAQEGYLIFKPDIYYKFNKSGESALLSVESAIRYLGKYSWIDTTKLGINGCSYGGFETNYIIAHSRYFKAACSASSISDLFSYYNNSYEGIYTSFTYGQLRMKRNLWEDPDYYINNSPLFKANDIETPLLLFHTTNDGGVKFSQAAQLFLIMRRLRKPVWLLEYKKGDHGVFDLENKVDFSLRMNQFYNHYLKDSITPIWLKK